MSIAFVFPGQGSQAVGMGAELLTSFAEARHVLQEVDEALRLKLSTIIAQGPEDQLALTEHTQPAVMAISLAVFRVMQTHIGVKLSDAVACVAGHSLGEYSALTAAGALSITECAKLLQIRGRAMQAAVPVGRGGMVAVIGPDMAAVQEIVAEARRAAPGEVIEIANQNAPNQTVLSGTTRGMEMAMTVAKEKGAKRALPLPVSAPFHCSLMAPAASAMEVALEACNMRDPEVPLVANVTAKYVRKAPAIKSLLVQQVAGTVRWVDSVLTMQAAGITHMVEIGHGNVLAGLIKRIAPDMVCSTIATPSDIEHFAQDTTLGALA